MPTLRWALKSEVKGANKNFGVKHYPATIANTANKNPNIGWPTNTRNSTASQTIMLPSYKLFEPEPAI